MTVSTDATSLGNPENPHRLAPHGGCWWQGCKTCFPGNPGNSEWSRFIAHDRDVQIDPHQVRTGDMLLIAEKDTVRVGSHVNRLIAVYTDIQVVLPDSCVFEGERHTSTVCTLCIQESWLWDYLFRNVRTLRNFAHGTPRAYDHFGCRCARCTRAHNAYLGATSGLPYAGQVPELGSK